MHNPGINPARRSVSNDKGLPEAPREAHRRKGPSPYWIIITLAAFVTGSVGGYFLGSQTHQGSEWMDMASLIRQINPPDGYTISATFGDIGPEMLKAGAMEAQDFIQVYEQAGQPLDQEQLSILQEGSPAQVVFTRDNAYFLLNFFWALGLTNDNPVLTEGPMVANGRANVVNYASTGGWTLAAKPMRDLYASTAILELTPQQQVWLEEVVKEVYRPCCDNPVHFPDCNHGMAMLGLMELMASQGSSVEEMFEAAKYANAYWYPQQTLEIAAYFKSSQSQNFDQTDSRQVVGKQFSSLSGFRTVHQWLAANGLLQQAPGGGNSCGV